MNAMTSSNETMNGALHADPEPSSAVAAPYGAYRPGLAAAAAWRLAMHRLLPKGLRKPFRRRVARRFPGPYDVTAGGFDWRLTPAINYCDRVLMARRRFPEIAERAGFLTTLGPGDVFIDVGANIGTYALDAGRRVGPQGRVIAIEPNPETFRRLTAHLALNAADNVAARCVAIAPEPGRVRLWLNAGSNIGQSSLIAAGAGRPERNVEVPALPLAELLAQENVTRAAALKVDVEGFEDRVVLPFLNAAEPSLLPRRIQIETVHRDLWQSDCVDALKDAGYVTLMTTPENEILERAA